MSNYTDPTLRDAYERGVEAAEAAASWTTDAMDRGGRVSREDSARSLLAMMEEGDPEVFDYLPAMPNLSGEYADDPTPQSLARDVTGLDDFSERPELVDEIAQAFENGVSETFEAACERELHSFLT